MDKRTTLFLFPFAGGSKRSYRGFLSGIPPSIDTIPLELPGRGTRISEALLTDIHEITNDLFIQVKDHLNTSYIFFGHSMGALLAYLVAQKIRENQLPLPALLFVSAFPAPSVLESTNQNLHKLSTKLFISKAREYSTSLPKEFQKETLFILFEPILRADFQAVEVYRYKRASPLPIRIIIMFGDQDPIDQHLVTPWKFETTGGTTIYKIEGGHFYILESPQATLSILLKEMNLAPCTSI